jgi:hypothetical protein
LHNFATRSTLVFFTPVFFLNKKEVGHDIMLVFFSQMKSTPNLLSTPGSKQANNSSQLFSLKNGKVTKSVGRPDVMRKNVLRNCHEKGRTAPEGVLSNYGILSNIKRKNVPRNG